MPPREFLVAAAPRVGELASGSAPGELLSLIDAIEQKLALAREAVKTHGRASPARSGASVEPGDQNDGVRLARPKRDVIGDVQGKD